MSYLECLKCGCANILPESDCENRSCTCHSSADVVSKMERLELVASSLGLTWPQITEYYAGILRQNGYRVIKEWEIPPVNEAWEIPVVATCQEASPFSSSSYVACGQPATHMVKHRRDRRSYLMCEMCADHNVRNRGGILVRKRPA